MGQICLGSNDSRINPHMHAKFGCSRTVMSKKGGGTDRETDKGILGFPPSSLLPPSLLLTWLHPGHYSVIAQDNCIPDILGWVKFVWVRMIPGSIRICMQNLVAVGWSCRKKGQTDTQRGTVALYWYCSGSCSRLIANCTG